MARELRNRVSLPAKDAQEHLITTPRRMQRTESKDSTESPSNKPDRETRMSARRKQLIPSATVHVASTVPHLVIIKGIPRDQFPSDPKPVEPSTVEEPLPLKRRRSARNAIDNSVSSKRRKFSPEEDAEHSDPAVNGSPTLENSRLRNGKNLDQTTSINADPNLLTAIGNSGDSNSSQGISKRHTPVKGNLTQLNTVQSSLKASSVTDSPAVSLPVSPKTSQENQAALPDPDDLDESCLPPPFLPRQPTPPSFQDNAAKLLHERYNPIPLPTAFLKALTSHNASLRSTETLQTLAQNTYRALVAWQDEYLRLDKKTAPRSNPIKKPATGGRIPMDETLWQQTKEIELWGHVLGIDGMTYKEVEKKKPAIVTETSNAPTQIEGRRARRRGADASLIEGLGISEDDAGASREKRARKPVRRFDAGSNGQKDRKRRNAEDSATEQSLPRKRGRAAKVKTGDRRLLDTESPQPDDRSLNGTASPSNYAESNVDHLTNDLSFNPTDVNNTPRDSAKRNRGAIRMAPKAVILPEPPAPPTNTNTQPVSSNDAGATDDKNKQRVKSEKRSESMTAWWAKRKRKQAEQRASEMRERGQGVFETTNLSMQKSQRYSGDLSNGQANTSDTKLQANERRTSDSGQSGPMHSATKPLFQTHQFVPPHHYPPPQHYHPQPPLQMPPSATHSTSHSQQSPPPHTYPPPPNTIQPPSHYPIHPQFQYQYHQYGQPPPPPPPQHPQPQQTHSHGPPRQQHQYPPPPPPPQFQHYQPPTPAPTGAPPVSTSQPPPSHSQPASTPGRSVAHPHLLPSPRSPPKHYQHTPMQTPHPRNHHPPPPHQFQPPYQPPQSQLPPPPPSRPQSQSSPPPNHRIPSFSSSTPTKYAYPHMPPQPIQPQGQPPPMSPQRMQLLPPFDARYPPPGSVHQPPRLAPIPRERR